MWYGDLRNYSLLHSAFEGSIVATIATLRLHKTMEYEQSSSCPKSSGVLPQLKWAFSFAQKPVLYSQISQRGIWLTAVSHNMIDARIEVLCLNRKHVSSTWCGMQHSLDAPRGIAGVPET